MEGCLSNLAKILWNKYFKGSPAWKCFFFLESYFDEPEEPTSINNFVTFLLTQVSFLSRFRMLKILTNMSEYTMSQENLNKLIAAYFSAPTTHLQKIMIADMEIKSYDGDVFPAIDHCYLQFKIIELEECHLSQS